MAPPRPPPRPPRCRKATAAPSRRGAVVKRRPRCFPVGRSGVRQGGHFGARRDGSGRAPRAGRCGKAKSPRPRRHAVPGGRPPLSLGGRWQARAAEAGRAGGAEACPPRMSAGCGRDQPCKRARLSPGGGSRGEQRPPLPDGCLEWPGGDCSVIAVGNKGAYRPERGPGPAARRLTGPSLPGCSCLWPK